MLFSALDKTRGAEMSSPFLLRQALRRVPFAAQSGFARAAAAKFSAPMNSYLDNPPSPLHGGQDRPTAFEIQRLDQYAEQISQYTIYILPLLFLLIYSVVYAPSTIVLFDAAITVDFLHMVTAGALIVFTWHLTDLMKQVHLRLLWPVVRPAESGEDAYDDVVEFILLSRAISSYPGALNPLFPEVGRLDSSLGKRSIRAFMKLLGTETFRLGIFVLLLSATFGLLLGSLAVPIWAAVSAAPNEAHGASAMGVAGSVLDHDGSLVALSSLALVLISVPLLMQLIGALHQLRSLIRLADVSVRALSARDDSLAELIEPLIRNAMHGRGFRLGAFFVLTGALMAWAAFTMRADDLPTLASVLAPIGETVRGLFGR